MIEVKVPWYQLDVLTSLQTFMAFWNIEPDDLSQVTAGPIVSLMYWIMTILVGKGSRTALYFVSEIENIIFNVTPRGYFSSTSSRSNDE